MLHLKNDLFIKAESSFLEALKMLKLYSYKFYISGCYLKLGQIYLELNQIENSLLFANKSFDISKELDTQSGILESKILLAKIHYKKNKSESIEQFENLFESINLNVGDILIFDNRCPHRSNKNKSNNMRRILYYTYSLSSAGSQYKKYFSDKESSKNVSKTL